MIVDTSALVAILFQEHDAGRFAEALDRHAGTMRLSAGSLLELTAVIVRSGGKAQLDEANALIDRLGIVIEPVTVEQALIGQQAYVRYGRGTRHPADLNFGDCFAYALAKCTGEPLLFKGADFAQTDVTRALPA